MKRLIYFTVLFSLTSIFILSCKDDVVDPNEEINIPEGYSLAWSDEFNNSTINMENWQFETGDGTDYGLPAGWGNNEMQLYTNAPDNSGIEEVDGESVLYIRAIDDGSGGFTSAKLVSKNKQSIRFGRIDVKAKMPEGQGILPAIWMLGDNIDQIDWPGCGEIDIAEVLGHEPNKMYSTLHYTSSENKHAETQESKVLSGENFSDSFHIFSVDWTPEKLTFSVDGMETQQVVIEEDMKEFLRSFYMILNVAVGGNWPGPPDNTTTFPQTMYVDYVRVFEKNGFNAPNAPELNIEEETVGQLIEPSLAQNAIKDDFPDLGNAIVVVYGGGGEPVVEASDLAVDGDSSLVFNFPGGGWGGAYIELESPVDLSSYNYIKFLLNKPSDLTNAEIKLESPTTNFAVFLQDYTGSEVEQGFMEYSIPLADFSGLDLTEITIPFAMWNPQDVNQNFIEGPVYIDRIYFSE